MFERVHTVTDYHDGPRQGVADYQGHAHAYSCEWSETEDDFAYTYLLTGLEREAFELAMEDWAIRCRWQAAFKAGRVDRDSHPVLPEDRVRHDDIQRTLGPRL